MTRLMLIVALTGAAVASLVGAEGVMDLLKSSIKSHKSPYSHGLHYGGNGHHRVGAEYGAHYGSPYGESPYGMGPAHNQYEYDPYSSGSHLIQDRYGRYGEPHGHTGYHAGYPAHGLEYGASHLPPPVYEEAHHHAGHLYGGQQHAGVRVPGLVHHGRHHNAGGSASSSAAAGAGGAAAAAAAGGSGASSSASVGGGHNDHMHGVRHGTKYGHMNSALHHAPGHLAGGHLRRDGLHYDAGIHGGAHLGAHIGGHMAPAHHVEDLEYEMEPHVNHGLYGHHGAPHTMAHGGAGAHYQHAGLAAEHVNEPEVYHNTELLPDGHKTSTFVDYQEKPIEQTMASASGTFSTDDQGIERSSYSRSTEHVQNKEDGHIDDDHYYQAQSYGKTHDDNLHEASNRDDEDYEVTPTGYRKKKRKGNYVKNHTKTTRETGSGVLAKDRHQAGFSKSINKLVENVNKNKVSHINGVAHDEHLSSSQNIDDGDEDFYDSDLARRGHNIPGPHVPTATSSGAGAASASSAAGASGSSVSGTGGGAAAASSAGAGGVSSSVSAGRK